MCETGDTGLCNGTSFSRDQYYLMVDKESITQEWMLYKSPATMGSVLICYLGFVLYLGPRLMASRKPFDLKTTMRVYNLVQILYNAYVLSQLFLIPGAVHYLANHSCRLLDPDNITDLRHSFLHNSWHYYVLKLLDLMDTVFMVLRKKESHISFLHLYHHTAMVFFTWYSNKFIKAQQATIPAFINLVVHTVMYSYYFLATFGPGVKRYLWWKKHLTKMQLLRDVRVKSKVEIFLASGYGAIPIFDTNSQFGLIILYLWLLYYNDCDVSQPFNLIWIINVCVIAGFFVNFYIMTYVLNPRKLTPSHSNKEKST